MTKLARASQRVAFHKLKSVIERIISGELKWSQKSWHFLNKKDGRIYRCVGGWLAYEVVLKPKGIEDVREQRLFKYECSERIGRNETTGITDWLREYLDISGAMLAVLIHPINNKIELVQAFNTICYNQGKRNLQFDQEFIRDLMKENAQKIV